MPDQLKRIEESPASIVRRLAKVQVACAKASGCAVAESWDDAFAELLIAHRDLTWALKEVERQANKPRRKR